MVDLQSHGGKGGTMSAEQMDFELQNVKRMVGLDNAKLDYSKMTDQ